MAEESTTDKLSREMQEKGPMEAIKDDLTGGDSSKKEDPSEAGPPNPHSSSLPAEQEAGQTDTPGGPGFQKQ